MLSNYSYMTCNFSYMTYNYSYVICNFSLMICNYSDMGIPSCGENFTDSTSLTACFSYI